MALSNVAIGITLLKKNKDLPRGFPTFIVDHLNLKLVKYQEGKWGWGSSPKSNYLVWGENRWFP
jgi:hypothetical protein